MVAGRLEIRVVSTPMPAANGSAEDKPDVISNVPPGTDPPLTNRADLQQAETEIANQVDRKFKNIPANEPYGIYDHCQSCFVCKSHSFLNKRILS